MSIISIMVQYCTRGKNIGCTNLRVRHWNKRGKKCKILKKLLIITHETMKSGLRKCKMKLKFPLYI